MDLEMTDPAMVLSQPMTKKKNILELWSGERVISASCAKMGFDTEDHEVLDQKGGVVLEHNLLVIETINGIEKELSSGEVFAQWLAPTCKKVFLGS